ncbi:MAG: hypothetical protein ACLTMP_09320 [Eggerthella lenta]
MRASATSRARWSTSRANCVLADANVVARIMGSWAATWWSASRRRARDCGRGVLPMRGTAGDLHAAWKVCLNVFDHMSAVAEPARWWTRPTAPALRVLTTRKSMPGAKDLLTEAVMAGGRSRPAGLSETVLVFDHHLTFFGGFEAFVEQLPDIRALR